MTHLTEPLTKIEYEDSIDYWVHPDKNYTNREVQDALLAENIIYDGYGIFPIKIIKLRKNQYAFVIGEEDDGRIWFKKDKNGSFCNKFNAYWTYHLIEMLMRGMRRIEDGKVK